MSHDSTPPLTYRDAGVDIDAGERLVRRIRPLAERTWRPGAMGAIGGFGGLFQVPLDRYRQPVLVSGTDGVGTKLLLAHAAGRHDTIGIDLVAMCANDVVVSGAEPLFFLDYLATGRLDVERAAAVVEGIAAGCEQAGVTLIGGETAEMPGMYHDGAYDLAGFCVGVAEQARLLDGCQVTPGDVLIGIASSGPHANGYSLIRKLLEARPAGETLDGRPLLDLLLEPTRIYVRPLLRLLETVPVKALAHITGGGLIDNLPRVLPAGTRAVVGAASWPRPAVFEWLRREARLDDRELHRTFNCGIGMVACVAPAEQARSIEVLAEAGETAWPIGRVEPGAGGARVELGA